MLHAAALDGSALGGRRTLNMPGVCATVREQIEALRRVAGESALRLIRRQYDPAIASIIASWPERFAPERAIGLGFRCEQSFDEIIQAHIEDQLASHQVVAV
jgi:nucleoside-diphosphate-sugar epimerase